ncbi:MAG: TRAM domain-containing protein [Caldilineales bacterium]|nr:TRAM domain-containing protein [Caldilineales bacterium]MDW8316961.1 TRAM domain-containing protein [Anaerolineae bacterium]
MAVDNIFRVIGSIIFGIIGWYLGTAIAGSSSFELTTLRWTIPFTLAGAVIGALVAPWITTKPARQLRRIVTQLPAKQLVAGTIGLAVGLVIAALLALPLSRLPAPFGDVLPAVGAVLFGYLGITVMVLRADDIAALAGRRWGHDHASEPEFKGDGKPVLLDSSVIIDGRIADISQTGFIMGPMLIPRFVLNEVQYIADSPDTLRRNRGRRGLDMLNKLQRESAVPVVITDMDVKNVRTVDDKLIQLAKKLNCPIMTNDFNLNQVAQLQGVKVLNINALANAVKVLVLPGESIQVQIIDEGKEPGQGVGYLDDGTMVVVEHGYRYINQQIEVQVTKVLQTNAGRMIFGQPTGG